MTRALLEYSRDPLSVTNPTWLDISQYLVSAEWGEGKENELDEPQAGSATFLLNNTGRRFEPEYTAGAYYPDIRPMRRFRLSCAADPWGLGFFADYEIGAAGTIPDWSAMNGVLECHAGAETRQVQYVTSPAPIMGTRALRVEVASGDQFGTSSGERCELRRTSASGGGLGTGTLDGQTVAWQFATRFLAPFTIPSGWLIFWQLHGATGAYNQPPFRWEVDTGNSKFKFRVFTGNYATSGDASAGTNAGVDQTHYGRDFSADQWWIFRHIIHFSQQPGGGWYIAEMRQSGETNWTRVAERYAVQTLCTTAGAANTEGYYDKTGLYRNTQAITNVAFHDAYQVAPSFAELGSPTITLPQEYDVATWQGVPNEVDVQVGNSDFEADITGTDTIGSGVKTLSRDTTRAKHGGACLKLVVDGGGNGQGAVHRKRSGSTNRFACTAGLTYTSKAWFSSDGFEPARVGMEWFDGGGVSLSTTYGDAIAMRSEFRYGFVTAVAPANAVSYRIRTSLMGTFAATFYVDWVATWQGALGDYYRQGLYYATGYELLPTDQSSKSSQVRVTCVDGFGIASLEALPALTPRDATSYSDVVAAANPAIYLRLGDPAGTKASARMVRVRLSIGGGTGPVVTRRRREGVNYRTRSEAVAVSGPAGTYKALPKLEEPGLILGDPDTCVFFDASLSQYVNLVLDDADQLNRKAITLEAWIKPTGAFGTVMGIFGGPSDAGGDNAWSLYLETTGALTFSQASLSSSALSLDTIYHVVATWDGQTACLYVNGVLVAQASASTMATATGNTITIGKRTVGLARYFNGWIDEPAIYERALSAEKVMEHYVAGSQRGYAQQLAGARVAAVAASPLWAATGIDQGQFLVPPRMQYGQRRLDAVLEAVRAEMPTSHFYFDGLGNPVYRGWGYQDSSPANTPRVTFGDVDGEVTYLDLGGLTYDDQVFNRVTITGDSGTPQVAVNTAGTAELLIRDYDEAVFLQDDQRAADVAGAILSSHGEPRWRVSSITAVAKDASTSRAILGPRPGDLIRVRKRENALVPVDIITTVLGRRLALDVNGHLYGTFTTARGFNAATSVWRAGVAGFSEAGSTTIAG